MKSKQAERLIGLTDEKFEKLPFGAIRIAFDGTIQSYNHYEAMLARLDAHRVIGKNFFRDIAPCTGVQAFEGRMHEFLATQNTTSDTFSYTFPFPHGTVDVAITFGRIPAADTVLIAVERVDS